MRHLLTDADVLTFAIAGCNAAEVAAYAGIDEDFAASWLRRVYDMHMTGEAA